MTDSFGQFLQVELNKRSWTYSDLANHSGLHVSLISRVVRGQRRPTPNFAQRCATALELPLSDVMIAAGLLEEAVSSVDTAEAKALQQYIQYATTPEGEAEIAERLPDKLNRVCRLPDTTGKVALLLDGVAQLVTCFRQATGTRKALIGGALLYFLSPVDLIPDFIPISGLLDDFAVVSMVLGMVASTQPITKWIGEIPHV